MSAVLRAILYSDDSYYRLAGYRKIDPITGLQGEAKFLEAVEALFWKGKRDDGLWGETKDSCRYYDRLATG